MSNDPRGRSAFTLIELLIAVVLGAMLMAAVVTTMRLTIRHRTQLESIAPQLSSSAALLDQLRRDVTNAQTFAAAPNSLWLTGNLARDPDTGNAMHQPAMVQYRITSLAGRPALIRAQANAGATITRRIDVQPAWIDAAMLVVTSTSMDFGSATNLADDDDPLLGGDDGALTPPSVGNVKSVPANLRIRLLDARGRSILDETIVHHSEVN